MALVRWDPFRSNWPSIWDWDDEDMGMSQAKDNLDIYETEDEVVVKANIAGVGEDEVEITYEKGVLWIRGEAQEEEKEGKKYFRKASRSYSYKIAVPGNIDPKLDPAAEIEHGIVTISFKKAEEAKPKKISVKKK